MDLIVESRTVLEDLRDKCEHELERSLTIEDWAVSEDLTSFIHEVD